jgi:hypothetical protein
MSLVIVQPSLSEVELQHQCEVADAELGVAEELGWAVAALAGLAAHLKLETWLVTVPIAIGAYVLSIYRYRRRAATADDNYYRVTGLGKYVGTRTSNDA